MQVPEPLCNVLPDDAILDLHVRPERFAGEQGQEGLADGLMLRAVHEGQVLLPQNILGRGVERHEQ